MDKITCVVKRSTWARAGINGASRLVNADDNMCCLGFLGEMCGVSREHMADHAYPRNLSLESERKYLELSGGAVWVDFANINDDQDISDTKRESLLQELAKKNGFTFVFED